MSIDTLKKILSKIYNNKDFSKKTVLFHRDYLRFQGGHLKVWHYFNHLKNTNNYSPKIYFTDRSTHDADNPWREIKKLTSWQPTHTDILFLAGLDWQAVLKNHNFLRAKQSLPVINLIQGLSHAQPLDVKYEFLSERAIRICVSEEVSSAIKATNKVNGPIFTIPNGISLSDLPKPLSQSDKSIDLLIIANKKPELGNTFYDLLKVEFSRVHLVNQLIPRKQFLALLNQSKNCLFLPHIHEGFYLPALEAMALNCIVICPDCIGNRGFCKNGKTCLSPAYSLNELLLSVQQAKYMSDLERDNMLAQAKLELAKHSLEREKAQFLEIINHTNDLW